MTDDLRGIKILLVEDQYLIAQYLEFCLEELGAQIIGPCATVQQAIAHIEKGGVDCAILDISVLDGKIYPAAALLDERGVPYIFLTGYDADDIPVQFRSHMVCDKNVHITILIRHLCNALGR